MQKIIKYLKAEYFTEFVILLIIGLVPLYFNYFYASSIDLSKMVLFKSLLFLLLLTSVWRFAFKRIIFDKKSLIFAWPLLVFFLGLVISVIFSINVNISWFGSYARHEGLSSYLFYGLWLVLFSLNFNDIFLNHAKLKRLLFSISLSGFLVSIYAIFQLFGWDFFTWSEPASLTRRAFSSLGQPNFLATWLLLVLPFSAYFLYVSKRNWTRVVLVFLLLIELIALFSTGSRSAFLIFFVVSVAWLLWFLMMEKKYSKKYFYITIASSLALLVVFVTALYVINPVRLSELSDFKKGSVNVRFQLWNSGLKAFLEKPLLGYGLDAQTEAYIRYYEPDWAVYARPNTYSDRAHNLILDTLLTGGLVGLAALALLLWWAFKNLWQAYKKSDNKFAAFLIWALAAYLFVLLFNFSIVVTNIYFFLLLALAWLSQGQIFQETEEKYKLPTSILVIIGVFILAAYSLAAEQNKLAGEYYFSESLIAISEKQYFEAMVLNDYLYETLPDPVSKAHYLQAISLALIENLPTINDKSSQFIVDKYLRFFAEQAKSQDFESQFVKAFITGLTGDRVQSEEIFNKLSLLSPSLPKIYLAWGDVALFNNNPEKALLKFEKAKSLLPSLNNIYLNDDQKNKLSNYYAFIETRVKQANSMLDK